MCVSSFSRLSFISFFYVLFFLQTLADTFPWIQPLYDGCLENRNHWQDLAEKVEMGLTWIDHDTIEKPVEEFHGGEFPTENQVASGKHFSDQSQSFFFR